MKKTFHYLLFSLSLLTIALVLCSCGAEEKQTATTYDMKDNIYVLARNNQWGILNSNGEFVIAPQEYSLNILRDSITHAPKYIQASKIIPGEKDEEYDVYWDNQYQTALYDTKGNLIYDFDQGHFSDAFGDYLCMYRNEKRQMVNMKTGDAIDIENININTCKDYIIFSSYDEISCTFYDQNMVVIKELPDYYYCYAITDGDKTYFIVQDEKRDRGILDEHFNLIVPCQYNWINEINGNYLLATDNSDCSMVLDLSTGEQLFVTAPNENIYYCDGNVALRSTNDKTGKRVYDFIHLQDPENFTTYPYLSVINNSDWGHMAKGFLAKDAEGNYLILDTNGEVFLAPAGECWAYGMGSQYIAIEYYGGKETRPVELYQLDGTKVELPKDYASIHALYNYQSLPYLEAGHWDRQDNWRIDILDENGNLLVENLQIYTVNDFESDYCDGYRILARRGFSQGLMDMEGNWIYKESAFDSFGNEF